MIAGMMEIKINAAQYQKVKQWEVLQSRIYDIRKRGLYLHAYEFSGVQLLTQLKNLGINFLCVYLVIDHRLTLGMMMSIGYITGLIAGSMDRLIVFLQSLQQAQLTFQRLDEIWQQEDEVTPAKTGLLPGGAGSFYLDKISFKYGGSHQPFIFNDLSLKIPKGKITAIVGTSGSGKTTLLKLLLAFYNPQQGAIYLDDRHLEQMNNDEWRKQCGVVMQDGFIFSGTIAQNIALEEEAPNETMLEKAIQIACLSDLVAKLPMGFNTKIGKTGMELSGGEKQRILIARAVYKNPNYLFFDEATSNLDASNEKFIMHQLMNFFKGKTVVIIAHRLSTVKNADQIVVLEKGKITGNGNHEQLIKEGGTYLELIKNQLELGR
jgi:ATP-binding cassette subfamily B protein